VDHLEEVRLIHAAQSGDADAFAELYRDSVQPIYRYILFRVHDRQLAEDLTSDVFLRALKGLSRYVDQGRPFVAWLYTIAHARIVDHYRRSDRRPLEQDLDVVQIAARTDMDRPMLQRQAARELRRAIARLTPDQQQVIILRFIEGKRTETVAEIMGKKPNAIKALQHRALRTLAKHLDKAGFAIDDILSGL
jgi:RNA polymerase sigma-70 factor, ECF subfamily